MRYIHYFFKKLLAMDFKNIGNNDFKGQLRYI